MLGWLSKPAVSQVKYESGSLAMNRVLFEESCSYYNSETGVWVHSQQLVYKKDTTISFEPAERGKPQILLSQEKWENIRIGPIAFEDKHRATRSWPVNGSQNNIMSFPCGNNTNLTVHFNKVSSVVELVEQIQSNQKTAASPIFFLSVHSKSHYDKLKKMADTPVEIEDVVVSIQST